LRDEQRPEELRRLRPMSVKVIHVDNALEAVNMHAQEYSSQPAH
jgi:hypothetical protein